jgi:hypothetical protein
MSKASGTDNGLGDHSNQVSVHEERDLAGPQRPDSARIHSRHSEGMERPARLSTWAVTRRGVAGASDR